MAVHSSMGANYVFYYHQRNRAGNVFADGKSYRFSPNPQEDIVRRKPAKKKIDGYLHFPRSRARYPFFMPVAASPDRRCEYEAILPLALEYTEGEGL